jgi:hypothetical protein
MNLMEALFDKPDKDKKGDSILDSFGNRSGSRAPPGDEELLPRKNAYTVFQFRSEEVSRV